MKEAFEELLKRDSRNNIVVMNEKSSGSGSNPAKNSVNASKSKKSQDISNSSKEGKRKCSLM